MRQREPSPYIPQSTFAYPREYDVVSDIALLWSEERATRTIPTTMPGFTPLDALKRWVRSGPGHWQVSQEARYPTFHRDLELNLIPEEHQENPDQFRLGMLSAMTTESPGSPYPGALTDIDTIGHLSRTLQRVNTLLDSDGPLADMGIDPSLADAIRHGLAIHDIAESEFSGILLRHPRVVGDISAAIGKTPEDRQTERAILEDLLDTLYSDVYTDEMREIMIKLICHDVDDDKLLQLYHDIQESAHNNNAAFTGAAVGYEAPNVAPSNIHHANLMTLLAEQSAVLLAKKNAEIRRHSPWLMHHLGRTTADAMLHLKSEASNRDENDAWLQWRNSDAVTERFGEYSVKPFEELALE